MSAVADIRYPSHTAACLHYPHHSSVRLCCCRSSYLVSYRTCDLRGDGTSRRAQNWTLLPVSIDVVVVASRHTAAADEEEDIAFRLPGISSQTPVLGRRTCRKFNHFRFLINLSASADFVVVVVDEDDTTTTLTVVVCSDRSEVMTSSYIWRRWCFQVDRFIQCRDFDFQTIGNGSDNRMTILSHVEVTNRISIELCVNYPLERPSSYFTQASVVQW